jgi:putative ABC transport system permease protein
VLGLLFVLGGVFMVLSGLNPDEDASTNEILFQVGGGAALVFIGVALLARLFIAPVTVVLAPVLARGTTGRVAKLNVLRNRARSASTAIALMIGLALATLILVLYSSTIRTIDHQIDSQVGSDVSVSNPIFSSGLPTVPPDLAEAAASADGVERAYTMYVGAATKGKDYRQAKSQNVATATSGTFDRDGALELIPIEGDLEIANDEIAVSETWAADNDAKVGDEVELTFPDDETRTFTVGGVFRDSPLLQVPILLTKSTYDATQSEASKAPARVMLMVEPGVKPSTVVERIDKEYGKEGRFLDVLDNSGLRDQARSQLRPFIGFILAMLALSLVIALFGISNTLALNVFERTREVGLLRAIGATRRQLRRMIRIESVLVALFGAFVGTILGVLGGIALVEALESQGFLFDVSPLLIGLVLVGGIVAGLLASILPARRASHMDVLEAIATE